MPLQCKPNRSPHRNFYLFKLEFFIKRITKLNKVSNIILFPLFFLTALSLFKLNLNIDDSLMSRLFLIMFTSTLTLLIFSHNSLSKNSVLLLKDKVIYRISVTIISLTVTYSISILLEPTLIPKRYYDNFQFFVFIISFMFYLYIICMFFKRYNFDTYIAHENKKINNLICYWQSYFLQNNKILLHNSIFKKRIYNFDIINEEDLNRKYSQKRELFTLEKNHDNHFIKILKLWMKKVYIMIDYINYQMDNNVYRIDGDEFNKYITQISDSKDLLLQTLDRYIYLYHQESKKEKSFTYRLKLKIIPQFIQSPTSSMLDKCIHELVIHLISLDSYFNKLLISSLDKSESQLYEKIKDYKTERGLFSIEIKQDNFNSSYYLKILTSQLRDDFDITSYMINHPKEDSIVFNENHINTYNDLIELKESLPSLKCPISIYENYFISIVHWIGVNGSYRQFISNCDMIINSIMLPTKSITDIYELRTFLKGVSKEDEKESLKINKSLFDKLLIVVIKLTEIGESEKVGYLIKILNKYEITIDDIKLSLSSILDKLIPINREKITDFNFQEVILSTHSLKYCIDKIVIVYYLQNTAYEDNKLLTDIYEDTYKLTDFDKLEIEGLLIKLASLKDAYNLTGIYNLDSLLSKK